MPTYTLDLDSEVSLRSNVSLKKKKDKYCILE